MVSGDGVTVSWTWIIHGFWFNFIPFPLLILIKIVLDSFTQRARTRNTSVYVQGFVEFAISHVIARTSWRVIDVVRHDPGDKFMLMGILPVFIIFQDIEFILLEGFVMNYFLFRLDISLMSE